MTRNVTKSHRVKVVFEFTYNKDIFDNITPYLKFCYISLTWVRIHRHFSKHRYHFLNVDEIMQNDIFTIFD